MKSKETFSFILDVLVIVLLSTELFRNFVNHGVWATGIILNLVALVCWIVRILCRIYCCKHHKKTF